MVDLSKIPTINNSFGLPTWFLETYDANGLTATVFVVVIAMIIALMLSSRLDIINRKFLPSLRSPLSDDSFISLLEISSLIRVYIVVTFLAVGTVLIFGLGKMFSTFGSMHNAGEIGIILFLGSPNYQKYYYKVTFIYLIFIWTFSILLTWPFDAIFFKWQGLIFDTFLLLEFMRLNVANKANVRMVDEERLEMMAESAADEETLEFDGSSKAIGKDVKSLKELSATNARGSKEFKDMRDNKVVFREGRNSDAGSPIQKRLVILMVAAFFHLIGNMMTTIDKRYTTFVLHAICYVIAYPMYGFFVFKLRPTDEILYAESTWKARLYTFAIGLAVSTLTIITPIILKR